MLKVAREYAKEGIVYTNIVMQAKENAPAENRTRGRTMATFDFTTKPLELTLIEDKRKLINLI